MAPKIVFVHGFNDRDAGKNNIDKLAPYALEAGWMPDVDNGDYGYYNLFMIRFTHSRQRRKVLYRLARAFEETDVICTFSNGANFANQALDMLGPKHDNTKLVIHISPALDRNTYIPDAVRHQLVMYTPHDGWVTLSALIPGSPWGAMGSFGRSGNNIRNTNEKHSEIPGHSGWFKDEFLYQPTWVSLYNYVTGKIVNEPLKEIPVFI